MRHKDSEFSSSQKSKKFAYLGLVFGLLLAVLGSFGLRNLQTEYSIMQFLPEHHPAIQMDREVRSHFHLEDLPLFVAILTLPTNQSGSWLEKDRLVQLLTATDQIKQIEGVRNAVSLSNIDGASEAGGVLNIGPLIKVTPPEKWRERILTDVLLSPQFISANARTALIYVQLKDAKVKLLMGFQGKLKEKLAANFSDLQMSIGGVPAVQTDLGLLLNKELQNFIALTIVACALTLFLIFRSLSTILIPLILTAFANLMVFAMMAWSGLAFTILSATIPILVFITVVSLSVHFLLRVDEEAKENKNHATRYQLLKAVNSKIWLPNLLGALTTCVGFLTLLFGDVPLIRNYGIGVAAAVILSWLLTSFGILPFLLLFPIPQPRAWVHHPARWALWTIKKAKFVVSIIAAFSVILALNSRHLDWTGKLFDDLPEGHEARKSTEHIDRDLGGVIPMELIIQAKGESVWNDPERMNKLDQLLKEFRMTPGIGSARSIPDLFHATEHLEHPMLTNSRKAIAEIYFLYSLSEHNPIENYLADEGQSMRVEIRLHDIGSDEAQSLVEKIKQRTQALFPNDAIHVGGMGAIAHIINDELSNELIFGFWQALGIIVVLLAFIFRSLRWALVACIPNLLPPVALLAYLSLTHTPIKPGVAIIFSIALGLAFNNTVYVLNRLKELKSPTRPLPISKTFYLEGNPCLISTCIMLVGFSVFLFSYFSLNRTFGACMMVSILGGLLGDLIFLPAFLYLFPWMLLSKKKNLLIRRTLK